MRKTQTVLVASNHADIVGGGEISLLALLSGLHRTDWAPVAVIPAEGEVARRCRTLGIPSHMIPFPSLRWLGIIGFRSVLAIRRLVRETAARLIHANGSRAMFYAGLAGRLEGRSVIWHVRVADRDVVLDRVLARLSTRIIVTSKAVETRFSWLESSKIRRIYNGVDLGRFSPHTAPHGLKRSLQVPDDAPVVLSIGRFVPYKGYDHLLEAVSLMRSKRPDVHWVLVGDGELKGQLLVHCQRLNLQAVVHFTGWREDVADLLAVSDLFVLPSLSEHFGRVLIEAMAMGKPVVATDAGGVPEIVLHGETGLLVAPAQPRPFADAMLRLLEDRPLATRFGKAGRQRAERQFSLSQHILNVEEIYAECV
jgi:glycosyltransferase involved in cell wall biosynthesis